MFTFNVTLNADMTRIEKGVEQMALDLQNLQREVAENTSAVESAIALMTSLAEEIRANAGNQAALEEMAERLDRNSEALAEAVAANTEAEETPEEELPPIEETPTE